MTLDTVADMPCLNDLLLTKQYRDSFLFKHIVSLSHVVFLDQELLQIFDIVAQKGRWGSAVKNQNKQWHLNTQYSPQITFPWYISLMARCTLSFRKTYIMLKIANEPPSRSFFKR